MSAPTRLAIVGGGPRALSILERLAARAAEVPGPVEIHLIDAVQVGCGQVWRTGQPDWYLMNTVAGEITAFSGPPDGGPARPGAGPSFAQWWDTLEPDHDHANDYAPRNLYGRYLLFLLDVIERNLPSSITLHRIVATVTDLRKEGEGYCLTLHDGREIRVDRAAIATGHARPRLSGRLRELQRFAESEPALRFIPGGSAADMPLSAIGPGSKVGVIGMGLTFYDVVAALTVGRGGRFTESRDGLAYVPSGNEPSLVAGSRSGFPQPARGRNQKPAGFLHRPVFFTEELVRTVAGSERLDMHKHLTPRLMAEVDFVYFTAVLRERSGVATAEEFAARVRAGEVAPSPNWRAALRTLASPVSQGSTSTRWRSRSPTGRSPTGPPSTRNCSSPWTPTYARPNAATWTPRSRPAWTSCAACAGSSGSSPTSAA